MEEILDARSVKKGRWEYLISWKDEGVVEDTWVAEHHIPLFMHY